MHTTLCNFCHTFCCANVGEQILFSHFVLIEWHKKKVAPQAGGAEGTEYYPRPSSSCRRHPLFGLQIRLPSRTGFRPEIVFLVRTKSCGSATNTHTRTH